MQHLPIIPRLKAFLANAKFAQQLQYRTQGHTPKPNIISDIFDSLAYQTLLGRKVVIDGQEMPYTFFCDLRDLVLGLSTDGFAPFKRRRQTAWPLIIFNYNLPPEIRFHLEHIICLGVIPGPSKPKDMCSFLYPLIMELLKLERGVSTYDISSDAQFVLRAFLILVFGDIPAVSMLMVSFV